MIMENQWEVKGEGRAKEERLQTACLRRVSSAKHANKQTPPNNLNCHLYKLNDSFVDDNFSLQPRVPFWLIWFREKRKEKKLEVRARDHWRWMCVVLSKHRLSSSGRLVARF